VHLSWLNIVISDLHRLSLYNTSSKVGREVSIDPTLCLYSPQEVYYALSNHKIVKSWLNFMADLYEYPNKKIILIYPCSTVKPYTKSQSYKQLYRTFSRLERNIVNNIHLITISEPFGLVPSEFYNTSFTWYDCPGLFEWWCKKHGVN